MTVTVDKVIEAFVATRDELDAKKKEFEASIQPLKDLQEKRELYLASQLDKEQLTSFKGKDGTAFFVFVGSATLADRTPFFNWVHEDWDNRQQFLESRVSKTAVEENLEATKEIPPGVSYAKIRRLSVRKPTGKK